MLKCTIDFNHFASILVTLTMAGGHEASAKHTSWLHFLAHFLTDQDEIWCDIKAVQAEHLDTAF